MIHVTAQIMLYVQQRLLVHQGFAQCRFNNKRLKMIKYMEATFPNAEKLNIRG